MLRSALSIILPVTVVVAGLYYLILRNPSIPELSFDTTSCQEITPPTFTAAYGAVQPDGSGFRFDGFGYIEGQACTPGTLTLQAEGETFNTVGAQLNVMLDGRIIASPRFTALRTTTIKIPQPGRVQIAFANDEYAADVRIVFFQQIRMSNPNCLRLQNVTIPPENIGEWFPDSESGHLVRAAPASVTPCGAGRMSLMVSGQAGAGAFPILAIEQNGRRLLAYHTTPKPTEVKVDVTGDPVQLRVQNPYGVTTKDRNAILRSIQYRTE